MTRQLLAIRRDDAETSNARGEPAIELAEGVVADVGPTSGRLEKAERAAPRIEVRMGDRSVEARRATSCLLAPAAGDRVAVAMSGKEVFVLAVLERADGHAASVEIGVGVTLEVDADKSVSVRGARDLHLTASRSVTATSEEVRVQAGRARLLAKKVEAIGATLESSFDRARQLGRIVEVVADEVSSRLKRSLRFVSEIDQTRAGVVDMRAESVIAIHGENTCITARQIAKIDSNQIHIG